MRTGGKEGIDYESRINSTIREVGHWEETHCYLLCGTEKAVLIDTGLEIANIKEIIDRLTTLPVMVATTHIHWAHIGGHKYFDNIDDYQIFQGVPQRILGDGDCIDLGNRKLEIIGDKAAFARTSSA